MFPEGGWKATELFVGPKLIFASLESQRVEDEKENELMRVYLSVHFVCPLLFEDAQASC